MEVTECTRIVHDRIQNIEPENATKIIGYLLLTHDHKEIMEYACGADEQIHSLISEAKSYLRSSQPIVLPASERPMIPLQFRTPPTISRPFSSPSSFRVPAPHWDSYPSSDLPPNFNDFNRVPLLRNQTDLLSLEEQLNHQLRPLGSDYSSNYCYSDAQLGAGFGMGNGLRSPTSLRDIPVKICNYFYKGYCKHGINCRYSHGQTIPDSFPQIHGFNPNELVYEDHDFKPGSLERLEIEISELLKDRNGVPVSIAALPMMYHEKYGKQLQSEGYLTESQRHGKAGYSLTKLLARLRSVRLIDKPHGQHAVVLAEEASKYMECMNDRSDAGAVLASSHQIYLTFPAESTFTDDDVLNYFNQFGLVRDVRIPRQEKRMFGFVSFMHPETVKSILAKGHPHFICGSRVLVKPYKEKSRINDRFTEKTELPMPYSSQYLEMDPDPQSRLSVNYILWQQQLLEEQERALEIQRMRLLEMQLTPRPLTLPSYFSYRMDDLKGPADSTSSFPVIQTNGSTSDDKMRLTENNCNDSDSNHIELPDSPFASPRIGNNNVYTVV